MRIRLRKNGPYVIEDHDARVVDWDGAEYPIDRWPLALCRCGGSATKPFCDGTHRTNGFQAAGPAPAAEPDKR